MKSIIRLKKGILICILGFFISTLTASAQQEPLYHYKIDGYQKVKYEKILVVARIDQPLYRKMIENAIVKELTDRKYKAVASYKYFSREDAKDSLKVMKRVDSLGVDAGLVVYYFGSQRAFSQRAEYNGNVYSIFGGIYMTIDIDTQGFNMAYVRTDFVKRHDKALQWSQMIELNMSKGIELASDELAMRTRRKMVSDKIL